MCCFSRPVDLVKGTHIFARGAKEGKQFIVYSMVLVAKEELAMILPIPTPKASKEDAIRFINLEKYEHFFKDMQTGFPPSRNGKGLKTDDTKLKVVDVGSYGASFVPTVKDFARLDERFKLPADVWEGIPQVKDFGFVVFKLKSGSNNVHPMAFEFPRANPRELFFPTVHIHDSKVHKTAGFDHALYCQHTGGAAIMNWRESPRPAGLFMKADQTQGIVDPEAHILLREMKGRFENKDVVV
jgi:hypothetical protein